MNTKGSWLKWVRITALVALVGSVTVGAVLAAPQVTPLADNSWVRFEQYLTALDQMEVDRIAAYDVDLASLRVNSLDYFEQYNAAIELAELSRQAAVSAERGRTADNSWVRFEQYLTALDQTERDRNTISAVKSTSLIVIHPSFFEGSSPSSEDEYYAALDQAEWESSRPPGLASIRTRVGRTSPFERYGAANEEEYYAILEVMEEERQAALLAKPSREPDDSGVRFQQYLDAIK